SVALFGAGMLAVLAAFCVMHLGSRAMAVYAPIVFPLSCAISYIAVQLAVYDESLMAETVRPFGPWILTLVIMQSLSLRQGFSHRFALAVLVIGIMTLPYMLFTNYEYTRASLDRTISLGNPNELAAWWGFCSVYFTVFGIETKRSMLRAAS